MRCTKKEVAAELKKLPNICCYFCFAISKYVFHINPSVDNCFKDTFDKEMETVDNFTFEDFENLLNE